MGCCNYGIDVPTSSGTPFEDWEVCALNMLRVMIGDLGTPPQYSDERLVQIMKVAGYYVMTDLACCRYVTKPAITSCGEFTSNPLDYPPFTNLMILKAACLVDQSSLRAKAAAEGIRATCGPATLQVISASSSYSLLLKSGPCSAYLALKEDLCFKCPIQSGALCAQILGPFVSPCGIGSASTCCPSGDDDMVWTGTDW